MKSKFSVAALAVVSLSFCALLTNCSFAEMPGRDMKQAAAIDLTKPGSSTIEEKGKKLERALFAGGCFWGTQYSFQNEPGVVKTVVGYTGGKTAKPTYMEVCEHGTGHAETVYVEFDPAKLSYRKLVDFFWTIHDPTTKDRQGPDFGDQYRSAIFYTSPEQKATAEASIKDAQASGKFHDKIVTQVAPATVFYPAEEYHQNYDVKHGSLSCPSPVNK
jgi:peptide-methionine (S)-S-oxide reductase